MQAITYIEAPALSAPTMQHDVCGVSGKLGSFLGVGGKGGIRKAGPDQSNSASNSSTPRRFARRCSAPPLVINTELRSNT